MSMEAAVPKGRGNGKGAPRKRTGTPRSMNKPAMMDWALRLLRLLNERKGLNSRIVAEEFDAEVAHFFERKSIFPRQEIVRKEMDGKIVIYFDVHNDMDFREHIVRWMPYFRVLEPARYREYIQSVATLVATRNEGFPG